MSTSDRLKFEVFVGSPAAMQPTSTLISGTERAILVDAQFIRRDARRLAHAIQLKKLRLNTIYITHAHADHYFGLEVLRDAFPDAAVVAAPEVARRIEATGAQTLAFWKPQFQKHLPDTPPVVQALDDETLTLEGTVIRVLHIDQGDIGDSTMLHVPSHQTLIAGDVVSNGTHLWLGETTAEQRIQWLRNLDAIAGLDAKIVIPGHKGIDNVRDHAGSVIGGTRRYLEDFNASLAQAANADDLLQRMMRLHGTREVPRLLQHSVVPCFDAYVRDQQEAMAIELSEALPRFRPPTSALSKRAPFTPPRFRG
jgi:glyoxylase-like metal-dependent hydrolase (beta-lactamase superfamily II)